MSQPNRSNDDMPRAGDTLQIINTTPKSVVFWRGTEHVRASQEYAGYLAVAKIPQIEKTFSIKLTKDEARSDEGNEYYNVSAG